MAEDEYAADFPSEIIREGKVHILVPKLSAYGVVPSDFAPSKAPVFYNPVMEFNRDLSVLAFKAFQSLSGHEITICEPLTSQGIRGIRYAAEIDHIKSVLLSDINRNAYELANYNIKLNNLQNKITIKNKDANTILSSNASPKKRFDIIDIDPFGTPVPYLDSAFRALKNKGVIAATATDLAPLCGVHAKACLRKYGGKPLRAEYCHELAVRLLAGHMAAVAAKNDIGIHFLFSHSSDHYIRVYAQIRYGCQRADESRKSIGYVLHCFSCLHREVSHQIFGKEIQCPECGSKMDYAGPLWTGNIVDNAFVEQIIKEKQISPMTSNGRITKLLNYLLAEAAAPATYFVIDKVSKKLNLPAPANQTVLKELEARGFQAVFTHFNPRGIKTDASAVDLKKAIKEIVAAN
jgi:tRNA (guanine26-N2/guanine27-N2)-dimethyltransferase